MSQNYTLAAQLKPELACRTSFDIKSWKFNLGAIVRSADIRQKFASLYEYSKGFSLFQTTASPLITLLHVVGMIDPQLIRDGLLLDYDNAIEKLAFSFNAKMHLPRIC